MKRGIHVPPSRGDSDASVLGVEACRDVVFRAGRAGSSPGFAATHPRSVFGTKKGWAASDARSG